MTPAGKLGTACLGRGRQGGDFPWFSLRIAWNPMVGGSSFRWFLRLLGLGVVVLAAIPAWNSFRVYRAFSLARQATQLADPDGAVAVLEPLAAEMPDRADVQYRMGVAYRRQGEMLDANRCIDAAEKLGWPRDDIERQRILMRFQVGRTEGATDYVESYKSRDLSEEAAEEVFEALARGYLTAYQMADARVLLDLWLKGQPDSIRARMWLGLVLARIDRLDDAMEQYEEVLRLAPEHVDARLHLAALLLKSGRVDEALAEFERSHQLAPESGGCVLGIANCQMRLGKVDRARELYEQALKLELSTSGQAEARGELGRLALEEGKTDLAIEHLREAVRLQPADASANYKLGLALAKAGQAEESKQYIDRSRELLAVFERITHASLQLAGDPKDIEERRTIADGLWELGFTKEAVGWYRTITWISPADRQAHERLAEHYRATGDAAQAQRHEQLAAGQMQPSADGSNNADELSGPDAFSSPIPAELPRQKLDAP
jgi:tetratricopeptide (TPR) repeat protein